MQPKRLIWAIAAVLALATLAGCAAPEEAGENVTDENQTQPTENESRDDTGTPPPGGPVNDERSDGIHNATEHSDAPNAA